MTGPASDELRAAVTARAQDTPYQVVPTPEGFDLRINVVDAHWYGLISAAGLKKVVEHRVALDESRRRLTMTDVHLDVRWDAALDTSGHAPPRLVASAQVTRTLGRTYEVSFNRTWAINAQGVPAKVVDFSFSSAEGQSLIREPAVELGWTEHAGIYQRIGLIAGCVGLGLAVLTGGALAVLAAMGRL